MLLPVFIRGKTRKPFEHARQISGLHPQLLGYFRDGQLRMMQQVVCLLHSFFIDVPLRCYEARSEDIAHGERIHSYVLEAELNGQWMELVKGSAIGHKKIDRFEGIRTKQLRLRVTASTDKALIRSFAAYNC